MTFSLGAVYLVFSVGLSLSAEILNGSVSPDGQLAITIPTIDELDENFDAVRNQIIETKNRKVVVTIEGKAGRPDLNHIDTNFAWSQDSLNLLWTVEGKWGPLAVVHLAFEPKGAVRQVNLREAGCREILQRLKDARPKEYTAAVKQNEGNGEFYPEGFTIDFLFDRKSPTLPIPFQIGLTANPKEIEGLTVLQAFMTGLLNADGELEWTNFQSVGRDETADVRRRLDKANVEMHARVLHFEKILTGEKKREFLEQQGAWERSLEERFDAPGADTFTFIGFQAETARLKVINERLKRLQEVAEAR